MVRRVEVLDRVLVMDAIMWSPPVRPFFERVDDVAGGAPGRARDPAKQSR